MEQYEEDIRVCKLHRPGKTLDAEGSRSGRTETASLNVAGPERGHDSPRTQLLETAGSRPGKTPKGGRAARTATHTREGIDWALVDARAGGGGHHQPQRSSRLSARPPPEGRRIR